MVNQTMRAYITGDREELISQLLAMSTGWWHLGNDRMRHECVKGVHALHAGATSVQVGHAHYIVTGGDDSTHELL